MNRQWWNRDTGYGLCLKCVRWMHSPERASHFDAEEFAKSYGKPGFNFPTEVTTASRPGDLVGWMTIAGDRYEGTLKEFDNGTAIVLVDGKEMAAKVH